MNSGNEFFDDNEIDFDNFEKLVYEKIPINILLIW